MDDQAVATEQGNRVLSQLLNVPRDSSEWAIWSWSHRDQHQQILQAVSKADQISLFEYIVDPIDFGDFESFLNQNQYAHNDFNGVLNTPGNDLTQVDPSDRNQLEAWIFLHFQEHLNAANKLQLG